ncbi:MAG: hypothetical protein SVV80_02140 [Planctomycetota bacterium]|nr:hypothetical protein [Planctomycetota bacterium]
MRKTSATADLADGEIILAEAPEENILTSLAYRQAGRRFWLAWAGS